MPSKLCKWGNSLGVRLPAYVAERAALRAGDYLFIRLTDAGDIVIRPVKARDIAAGYRPDDSPPKGTTEMPTDEWVRANW
jgi:antitoxin MazE